MLRSADDIYFRAPHVTDALTLAQRMRGQDVAEVHAAGHTDLQKVVTEGIDRSTMCFAAVAGSDLLCIFGVAPLHGLLGDVGVPWLLGTHAMTRHRVAFMRWAPHYTALMLRSYPRLLNFVHAENLSSVAWLKRAGFAVADAKPYGPLKTPFRMFTMEAPDVRADTSPDRRVVVG